MNNQIKTVLLLVGMSALFLIVGNWVGGQSGMVTALILSLAMNLSAYWFSDKIVLSMHQAKPIQRGDVSGVYEMVEELAGKAGLPMPKVYRVPDSAPNAFATGRNPENAAVAVTQGILDILTKRELRGVLAHEISHIQNRDILVSTLVACFASGIMYLAHMAQWVGILGGHGRGDDNRQGGINPIALLATIVLAPLVATLVQTAISRAREFMADETGALTSEDPDALASALQKISDPKLIRKFQKEEMMPDMQPAFSHLYIVNHFSGKQVMNWFSTHPPVHERVKKLMKIKKEICD